MFLRIFLTVLVSAFLLTSAYAQDANKSFIWKVKSNNSIAYILGSVHAMKEDVYPLDSKIEAAFQESAALALEIDLSKDLSKTLGMMMAAVMYQNNDTLKNHMTSAGYDFAASELKKAGINSLIIDKCKPWFLAMTLEVLELAKMGYNTELGIDKHFSNKAGGKKVAALETVEFQINLFSQFTDEEQEAFLLFTIRNMELVKREMATMVRAWKTGDAAKIDSLLSENVSKYPALGRIYEKLLYQRNRNMTLKIEDYLKTGETYFIVIGAGHLVGKKGIIEMLRNKGYSVKQM
jgi:uncharacterized protein